MNITQWSKRETDCDFDFECVFYWVDGLTGYDTMPIEIEIQIELQA